jgi:hypothetical protein
MSSRVVLVGFPARVPLFSVAISPEVVTAVVGEPLTLSARVSGISDATPSLIWEAVLSPPGAQVRVTVSDSLDVLLDMDRPGAYTIRCTVTVDGRMVSGDASVTLQAADAPVAPAVGVDVSWVWPAIGSFWGHVDEAGRRRIESLWIAFIRHIGADLQTLLSVSALKSTATAQRLQRRRWRALSLRWTPTPGAQAAYVLGAHQSGTGAATEGTEASGYGVVVSARTFRSLTGTPAVGAAGQEIVIYGGANAGTYTIQRVTDDGIGYVVSPDTPFPSPSGDRIASVSGLYLQRGSSTVRAATADFAALGVTVGDVLDLPSEGAGGFRAAVLAVGVAGGLASDRMLTIDLEASRTRSGVDGILTRRVAARYPQLISAWTSRVYLPAAEADLAAYAEPTLSGTGVVRSSYELRVSRRHALSSLVGRQIRIVRGVLAGTEARIAAISPAGDGVRLDVALEAAPGSEVSYEIAGESTIADRLLSLGGESHEIVSASLSADEASWVVTISGRTMANRRGISWGIGSVIHLPEESLVEAGVLPGDQLLLRVVDRLSGRSTTVPCLVTAVSATRVAYLPGRGGGGLGGADIYQAGIDLGLSSVSLSSTGALTLSGDAATLYSDLVSDDWALRHRSRRFQGVIEVRTVLGDAYVSLDGILRRRRVPVSDDTHSIPHLRERIDPVATAQRTDGLWVWTPEVGPGVQHVTDRDAVSLSEGSDYSLQHTTIASGSNAYVTAGSHTVTLPGVALDATAAVTGDVLLLWVGGQERVYYLLSVSGDTLRVADAAGAPPSASATRTYYTLKRSIVGTYIAFDTPPADPLLGGPETLWAPEVYTDTSEELSQGLGAMARLPYATFTSYGAGSVDYHDAVHAIIAAKTQGPTPASVRAAVAASLGLPVTRRVHRVDAVYPDYDVAAGDGAIVLVALRPDGTRTNERSLIRYPTATATDFSGLSLNPATGLAWAAGDVVPAGTAMTRSVRVEDGLSAPGWWEGYDISPVEASHVWLIEVDSAAVDSRAMPIAVAVIESIRPAYTRPLLRLVWSLSDSITISDDLLAVLTRQFTDTHGPVVESSFVVDSLNRSGRPHRAFSVGSFSTVTLFEGDDLVSEAGSAEASSARGGFTEDTGTVPYIDTRHQQQVAVRGAGAVRTGDYLRIYDGPNEGIYEIQGGATDTVLQIGIALDADGEPMYPSTGALLREASGQRFAVLRLQRPQITAGTVATAASTSVAVATGMRLLWDGVAAGDVLVLEGGADRGRHRVVRLGRLVLGVWEDEDDYLTLETALTATATVSAYVEREALLSNPIYEGAGETAAGGVLSGLADVDLLDLRVWDLVEVLYADGTYEERHLVEVTASDALLVDAAWLATGEEVTVRIRRPELEGLDGVDSDDRLALTPYDAVSVVLLRPRSAVVSAVDWVLSQVTATSGTASLVGVAPGMVFEVGAGHASAGVYAIDAAGAAITVSAEFYADGTGVTATVLEDDAAFDVLGDTVTGTSSLAAFDFEAFGVRPGDLLVLSGVGWPVLSASGGTIVLTATTGLSAAVTGYLRRDTLR